MAGVDLENTGYHPTATGPTGPVSEKWVFETGDRVVAGAAVSDGVAYIGSFDGHFYAIDIETGEEVWSTDLTYGFFAGTATIVDDLVVVNDGASSLYALNRHTGEKVWDTKRIAFHAVGSPTIIENKIYTHTEDGYLTTITLDSGKVSNEISLAPTGAETTAFSEKLLYTIGRPYTITAVDVVSGEKKWTADTGRVMKGLAITDELVLTGSQKPKAVHAVSKANGEIRWECEVETPVYSSVSVSSQSFFVCTKTNITKGNLAGEIEWTIDRAGRRSNPSLTDKHVFTGTTEGMGAYDRDSSEEMWFYETDNAVDSPPTIVNETLIFGAKNGNVYALE
ncbi:PQQ-binding-like beta-propeller repeat protein [Natronosalvus amylolyticus]|uniref:PQQ-binding-like beta-propeller repeat protein n=1 Tax=Natronosalvus amylolyticus TaxID=2961994 RepID=UPI0020C9FBF3